MSNVVRSITDIRKLRLRNFLIICFVFLPAWLYMTYCASGLFMSDVKLDNISVLYEWCLKHPMQCYNEKSIGIVLSALLLWVIFVFTQYVKMNNTLMHGQEYGSAKWGSIPAFNAKYGTEKEEDNKILSRNIRFRYDESTLRNGNIFVVGGSGAGKTSFFLTPNLLQCHGSNVYTDPKGSVLEELGTFLEKQKDTIVCVINLCEMEKSMHINPFLFLRTQMDVSKLISNLIQNTNSENIQNSTADPFWEKAEIVFLESLFFYVWLQCPQTFVNEKGKTIRLEKNMSSVLYLLEEAEIKSADVPTGLDRRMSALETEQPDHPAVKSYKRFRSGAADTKRSVLMTVNARMQPFDNPELLDIFSGNDIPLNEVGIGKDGDGKTKINLFIVIPDNDTTYNFVPGMIYTLLLEDLYYRARLYGGRLPIDVGFWLDEFANTKMPANFDKVLATCRSRGIYCVPMLQSLAQIKQLFKDGAWEGVVGNCDTFIYLGGNEQSTFEYITKLLGKWTIDKKTSGESRGTSGSYSENMDVLGRELMMEYEVRLLPQDECIIFVRGEEPLRDKKWFPWEYEEYKKAKSLGVYQKPDADQSADEEICRILNDESMDYLKKLTEKGENIDIYSIDALEFMKMDLVQLERQLAHGSRIIEQDISLEHLQEICLREKEEARQQLYHEFLQNYDSMTLFEIYSSDFISTTRKDVIQELRQHQIPETDIKLIIHPDYTEEEILQKKNAYLTFQELSPV
ncbi:MAG: type IV secretory system conjugative DNA transfer family protein [Roseburia sp.]|nr:type IV secretory system conjugative DNA transfer family protein [Roseburia sp.]